MLSGTSGLDVAMQDTIDLRYIAARAIKCLPAGRRGPKSLTFAYTVLAELAWDEWIRLGGNRNANASINPNILLHMDRRLSPLLKFSIALKQAAGWAAGDAKDLAKWLTLIKKERRQFKPLR